MDGEAVLRILRVELLHQPVARDLRENGRCGNGGRQTVSFDDGPHRKPEVLRAVAVDEGKVRLDGELVQRALHGKKRRLQNVDFVNLLLRRHRNAIAHGTLRDHIVKLAPLFVGQLFGVVESVDDETLRQNHRRGAHRSGKRTAPSLVHTADGLEAFRKRIVFIQP